LSLAVGAGLLNVDVNSKVKEHLTNIPEDMGDKKLSVVKKYVD